MLDSNNHIFPTTKSHAKLSCCSLMCTLGRNANFMLIQITHTKMFQLRTSNLQLLRRKLVTESKSKKEKEKIRKFVAIDESLTDEASWC